MNCLPTYDLSDPEARASYEALQKRWAAERAATAPFVPPGAQTKTLEQQEIDRRNDVARAQNDALRAKVERVMASKKELFYSPMGLRGLFPTNKCSLKIKKIKGLPSQLQHVDPQTQLQEAAEQQAEQPT